MEPDIAHLQGTAGKQISPAMGGDLLPFLLKSFQFPFGQFPIGTNLGDSPQLSLVFLHIRDNGENLPRQELVIEILRQTACPILPPALDDFFPDHGLKFWHPLPMEKRKEKGIPCTGVQGQGAVQLQFLSFSMIQTDRMFPVDYHAIECFGCPGLPDLLLPVAVVIEMIFQPFQKGKALLLQMVMCITFRFQEGEWQKLI